MPKIDPNRLKHLRLAKGWSQEELADKTQFPGRPKIDKQTISRLENGKQTDSRNRTVQQLARALGVDPAVLTSEAPLPEPDGGSKHDSLSHLGFRVSTSTRNALYLVGERYNVTHSEIVELAPFLFCWAAEASLRRRRERLTEAKQAYTSLQATVYQMSHLDLNDFEELTEKFAAERESIDSHDLFAMGLDDRMVENTFSDFLGDLAAEIGGDAAFDAYMWRDYPEYRVCRDEAVFLVDGNEELADEIVKGHIPLHEMPKDIRDIDKSKERAEWARTRLEEFQQHLRRVVAEHRNAEASP